MQNRFAILNYAIFAIFDKGIGDESHSILKVERFTAESAVKSSTSSATASARRRAKQPSAPFRTPGRRTTRRILSIRPGARSKRLNPPRGGELVANPPRNADRAANCAAAEAKHASAVRHAAGSAASRCPLTPLVRPLPYRPQISAGSPCVS